MEEVGLQLPYRVTLVLTGNLDLLPAQESFIRSGEEPGGQALSAHEFMESLHLSTVPFT